VYQFNAHQLLPRPVCQSGPGNLGQKPVTVVVNFISIIRNYSRGVKQTMYSLEINHLVSQEQHKDRLREIEHQQLLQAAGLEQDAGLKSHRKAASWLGSQMMKWGEKLQGFDTQASSKQAAVEIHR
jgi:hypothetical protein